MAPRAGAHVQALHFADRTSGRIGAGQRPQRDTRDGRVGEVKRLYVRPEARGRALGESLVRILLDAARGAGYRELKLDTLATMTSARRLYERLGFGACSPYYRNPLAGVVYMSRLL